MNFNKITFLFVVIVAFTLVVSCKKEETDIHKGAFSDGIFIVNEGTFQTGTGTVTFFKPDSNLTQQDIFAAVNGKPLGNIAQSMTIYNGKAYIVVNNADKVEIVDALARLRLYRLQEQAHFCS